MLYTEIASMDWQETAPAPKAKAKRKYPERQHQQALVKWLTVNKVAFCAIPNEGARSTRHGAVMKSLGLTPGVSDLFICEPRGTHGGMWVEMKAPGKIPTERQYDWLFKMRNKGYRAEWFDHWDKARLAIEEYLAS